MDGRVVIVERGRRGNLRPERVSSPCKCRHPRDDEFGESQLTAERHQLRACRKRFQFARRAVQRVGYVRFGELTAIEKGFEQYGRTRNHSFPVRSDHFSIIAMSAADLLVPATPTG